MEKDTARRSGKRFYYGWVIVSVALISMAFWFGFRSMFSVFLVALVDDFGWGRATRKTENMDRNPNQNAMDITATATITQP